jgi:glycosyltransferase involved in cell wall biosynthesis
VHLVVPPDRGADAVAVRCAAAGAAVSRLAVRGRSDLAGLRALRRLVACEDADVVHVHLASPVEALPALLAIRAGGARRVVTTEHAPTWAPLRRPWSRLAKRLISRGVDAVIAVSEADARFLAQEYGVPRKRLTVVPNGIELDRFERSGSDLRAARRRFALPEAAAFIVGFVGALEPKKGVLDLLAAGGAAGIEGLVVALAGDGSLGPTLEAAARECGVRLCAPGPVDDVPAFLAALDAFTLPSHQEAMPLALLEAMASALPIVATRVGGIPELIEDGATGLLVEPRRPDQLATALARLAVDRGLGARLGMAARDRVERAGSAERMVQNTLAVYGVGRLRPGAGARP